MRLWFEKGIKAKPRGYELMKMFSPNAFIGQSSGGMDLEKHQSDMQLLSRFYRKYPEVRYFPQASKLNQPFGGAIEISHPAAVFIKKQRQLINKGYTEQKAFEIVEDELGKFIGQQKEEMRILRGMALTNYGTSYIDRFQKVAEQESNLKVMRMERDIPKYLRAQDNWMGELNQMTGQNDDQEEEKSFQRKSIEEGLFQESGRTYGDRDPIKQYQPVLYQIVKDQAATRQKETFSSMQEGFIERTERLLQIFHQRSHIHDGLKNLSDEEVILKVREGPTKLRQASQSFLKKLKSYGVKLLDNGEIDYSKVKDEHVVKALQKKEALVKVTLMQSDLEFEYPQKLEKMMIKSDILRIADEEEAKLKSMAQQKEFEELQKKVLTYEEYYNSHPLTEVQQTKDLRSGFGQSRKDTKYEQFLHQKASKYIFDNDLLEQSYKFWETQEDRFERLKKIWIDLKRKNAIGGVEARTIEEQDQISGQVVDLARKIRFKIDQELTRRNIEPLFKENYRGYDKEEFLLDSDMEFFKIKKLLEKNPKILKEDPILGIDYLKIIKLIKRKKLVENTSDHYDPTQQIDSTFYDLDKIEREELFRKAKEEEKLKKEMEMGGSASGERLQLDDSEAESTVRANKKREEKEKQKLLKQFDALAEQFEKSNQAIASQQPNETAGDLKKKNKKKKEKTLAAKLRLKEKKTSK